MPFRLEIPSPETSIVLAALISAAESFLSLSVSILSKTYWRNFASGKFAELTATADDASAASDWNSDPSSTSGASSSAEPTDCSSTVDVSSLKSAAWTLIPEVIIAALIIPATNNWFNFLFFIFPSPVRDFHTFWYDIKLSYSISICNIFLIIL